eukprot:TRINITY_DN48453_c0_g1_i1.p1 TRINITY_DN48453_c0_g1~~TRINITY_DN48453_c0_g1_i1.p1  ORF type:complete len:236 (-),score=48.56 TRINITY_DN48453_c0_g1_i1:99-806(-)
MGLRSAIAHDSLVADYFGALQQHHDGVVSSFSGEEGGKQVVLLKDLQSELENFGNNWDVLLKKPDNGVTSAMSESWTKIRGMEDRLKKMEGYLWQCQQQEELLAGPRPDDKGNPKARDLMESSVAARINSSVQASDELVAAADKAGKLIGDGTHEGLSQNVNDLLGKLKDARHKIHEITVGVSEETMISPETVVLSTSAWNRRQRGTTAGCRSSSDGSRRLRRPGRSIHGFGGFL